MSRAEARLSKRRKRNFEALLLTILSLRPFPRLSNLCRLHFTCQSHAYCIHLQFVHAKRLIALLCASHLQQNNDHALDSGEQEAGPRWPFRR
jgi:hypothetical protein